MDKRAQMSAPFGYIFALILGGVIFAFLIGFAYYYIAFAGSLGAAELVVALEDEFAAFSVAESAEKVIDYDRDFDFHVYEGKITSNEQSQTLNQVLYAPFSIESEQLYVATKSLELPYRVTNLFYMADGRTIYILVYDTATQEIVTDLQSSYAAIPRNFPQQAFSLEQLEEAGNMETLAQATGQYDNVRFIFFADYDTVLTSIQSNFASYDIVLVESTVEDYSYGSVTFPDGEGIYLGYPMLIGAMVSYNAYTYNFNYDLVMEKLATVTSIYSDKARFLATRLPDCDYTAIQSQLSGFERFIGDAESYTSYQTKVEALEEANKALGGDCPVVF